MHVLTDSQLTLLLVTLLLDAIVGAVLINSRISYPVIAAGIMWLFRAIVGTCITARTHIDMVKRYLVNTSFVCIAALAAMLLSSVWVEIPINQNFMSFISILWQMGVIHKINMG